MKKIVLIGLMMCVLIPGLAFAAAESSPIEDGTSLDARSTPVSLSPNVQLSYNNATAAGDSYALTGGSLKGTVSYGVEAGNQAVYQMPKAVGAAPEAAADDSDTAADQYLDNGTWSAVGR